MTVKKPLTLERTTICAIPERDTLLHQGEASFGLLEPPHRLLPPRQSPAPAARRRPGTARKREKGRARELRPARCLYTRGRSEPPPAPRSGPEVVAEPASQPMQGAQTESRDNFPQQKPPDARQCADLHL